MIETALITLVCVATLGLWSVASADNPSLTTQVECERGYVNILVDGPGDMLTYEAQTGPLAGIPFRVVNSGLGSAHRWAFTTDVADLNTANSYDVQYKLTSHTNGQPTASKYVLTPASCSAKQVTLK
jgi:hypothetical protein